MMLYLELYILCGYVLYSAYCKHELFFYSKSCLGHQQVTLTDVAICFSISNNNIPKGYLLNVIQIDIYNYTKPLKGDINIGFVNRSAISDMKTKVKIHFLKRHKTTQHILSGWCYDSKSCTLQLSSNMNNNHNRSELTGILIMELTEATCNFDNNCTIFDEDSVHKMNASICSGKACNALPSIQHSRSQGEYVFFSPSNTDHPIRLTTKLIFGSGSKCRLHYSVWTRPSLEVVVTLHTQTHSGIIDLQEFTTYESGWKDVNIFIGKIDEHFLIVFEIKSRNYVSFDNFKLENCALDADLNECPSHSPVRCSTGKCLQHDHKCDLLKDCFYGDDEEYSLCGNSTVFNRCDFDNVSCGWQVYNLNANCLWELKDVNLMYPNAWSHGNLWLLNQSRCTKEIAAELVLPLRTIENRTTDYCAMRLSYFIEGKASLFIEQCPTDSTCKDLQTFKDSKSKQQWKTQSVQIPILHGRFKMVLSGRFNDEEKERNHAIYVDNISFHGDCFLYDDTNFTSGVIKSVKQSETLTLNDMIPWLVSTGLGSLACCCALLIIFAVCKQRSDKSRPNTYRKISTNSTTSTVLFDARKTSTLETCYDNESVLPFLGGSAVSNVSPLYDWSQIKDIIHIIPRNKITIQRMIGKGAFGEVYYGLLADVARLQKSLPVAVKMLPALCSEQSKSEFFFEAVLLSKLRHPNVVKFMGISVDEKSMYLLLELMEGGDLKSFVRECRLNDDIPLTVTVQDLLKLCLDVGKGCEYLEKNRFIHRDIAARNCLLSEKGSKRVAKIADFGMTKNVFRTNYYRKNGMAMVPVKWMPPEAFHDGVFTTKTDVWGFGIVLWEVFMLGRVPYAGKSNNEVMEFVANGGRLEKPDLSCNYLYELMCKCWEDNPNDRPGFIYITEQLAQIQKRLEIEASVIYKEVDCETN